MADPWSLRQLCDDGACVGVIGTDGRCKVCGRAAQNWGDERRRGLLAEAEGEADADRRTAADPGRRRSRGAAAADSGGDALADRRLCPDGNCIGLLDARGVCKVCGAVGEPARDDAKGDAAESGGDDDGDADDDGALDDDEDEVESEDEAGDDDADEVLDEAAAREGLAEEDDGDDEDDEAGAGYFEDEEHAERLRDATDDGRELCPDGACVGLIGADGRCKLCGLAREAAP